MSDQYGTGLLLMIWDITHQKDENMQSTMAYVEELLEFATTYHDLKQSNTDSDALIKSR